MSISRFARPLLCVAVALLPLPLLSGCGGSSGNQIPIGGSGITPASSTVTTTIAFANGQTGTLTLSKQSRAAGTLTIAAPTASARAVPHATTVTLPGGIYTITGSFTPPNSFAVTGTLPAPFGAFNFSGTIPTTTQTGSFTLTANGETFAGTIPIIGSTPAPTPTPNPTPTPTPTSGMGQISVTFTNSTINGITTPLSVTATSAAFVGASNSFVATYGTSPRNLQVTLFNNFGSSDPAPLTVGLTLPVASSGIGSPGNVGLTFTSTVPGGAGQWKATSGSVTITAVTGKTVKYRIDNVGFVPGFVNPKGTGNFTLNGTGEATAP